MRKLKRNLPLLGDLALSEDRIPIQKAVLPLQAFVDFAKLKNRTDVMLGHRIQLVLMIDEAQEFSLSLALPVTLSTVRGRHFPGGL